MKTTSLILRCGLFVFALTTGASAQTTPAPSVSGRLHLSISDGKGNTREMDLPEKGPMTLDLSPFKHLMENAEDMQRLMETAGQSLDAWASEMRSRMEKLGSSKEAWLGVAVQPVPETTAKQIPALKGSGLVVLDVAPGSPAATAGLQANDILWKIDDQALFNTEQFEKLIVSLGVGTSVNLTIYRAGAEQKLSCILSETAHQKIGDALAAAMLGPDGAAKVRELVGPGAEMILSAIASNPDLLKNLPALKQVLIVGPNGELKLADANARQMLEQLRAQLEQPAAKLPEIIEGITKALAEDKNAQAMLQEAMQEVGKLEKSNPELHKQLMEMVQHFINGVSKK